MSHYKPYPAYKDSGVEWLGPIPESWKVSCLGFEAWVRARLGWKGLKADEYVDDGYVFLSTPDIKGDQINFSEVNFITEERYEESPEIKLSVGDVLLAKDGSTLGTVNVVRNLPRAATVNSSIAVITPSGALNSLYLLYLFKGAYLENTIQVLKGGMGVPHLFQRDINKFKIPLPSLVEQAEIAAHLDHETTRIDALVAKKTRFIELLREKRQALITHAVTKGLDPKVKMKDSGVEWLGEVPEHWAVVRFRDLCTSISTGPFGTALGNGDYVTGGVPVINPSHIVDEQCCPDYEISVSLKAAERLSFWAMQPGDLVTSRRGELGRAAIITEEQRGWICGTGSLRVRPDTGRVTVEYLHTVLQSRYAREWLNLSSVGATMANLNEGILGQLPVAFPPSSAEQNELLNALKMHVHRLSLIEERAAASITLLKERRSALITAAVTGQIDLRAAV